MKCLLYGLDASKNHTSGLEWKMTVDIGCAILEEVYDDIDQIFE
jgi:predicted secreted protein